MSRVWDGRYVIRRLPHLPRWAIAAAALSMTLPPAAAAADPPPVSRLAPGYPVNTYDAAGNAVSSCTAGFVVHNEKGTPMMLTAGHCDAGGLVRVLYGDTGEWEPVGAFLASMHREPFSEVRPDIGVVPLDRSAVPVSADLLGRTPINGPAIPKPGQRLCKIGSFSGFTCGTVTNVTANKVFFDAHNRHGDSGGPVYLDNNDGTVTAVGVDSGTPDDHAECVTGQQGEQDCGGTTIAELVAPWMAKWGLSL